MANKPGARETPSYVAGRIRQPAPLGCNVMPGSTPVVAFGDPQHARVATLGLNPSRIEFEERGVELDGPNRRFETLRSLGRATLKDANDTTIARVWGRCTSYFHGNPYRWFDRLEDALAGGGRLLFRRQRVPLGPHAVGDGSNLGQTDI